MSHRTVLSSVANTWGKNVGQRVIDFSMPAFLAMHKGSYEGIKLHHFPGWGVGRKEKMTLNINPLVPAPLLRSANNELINTRAGFCPFP